MSEAGFGGRLILGLVLAFLYLPILVMVLMAFNASPLYALPMEWSTIWFERLPQNAKLMQATFNSLLLATATAVIATGLGTAASLGLARLTGRARTVLELLLIPPIAIPWLITGTAMLVFAFWAGIGRGLLAMLVGHVALAVPYVALIMNARLRSHRPEFEEAAQSLGATPLQAFRLVTLPLIAPAVITSALFAFAASLDQFVISYFLAGAGVTTLPVEIYAAIRKGFTPEINAVSTLVILVSMLLVIPAATRLSPRLRMSRVRCEGVGKRFGSTNALDAVTLDVAEGSLTALLGPSGSGKTTLLRAIAGFVVPDAGRILFDGETVERIPAHRRQIGMVFQAYALFPHLSVAENIAFGLRIRGVPGADVQTRVTEMLRLVRLEALGGRRPRQLSGGQQQRVALARALATNPRVLLLDEPLSALDRRLRQAMQLELRQLQRQVGITTIMVTHDQEEALTMADRIAVLAEGRLVQEGTPQEVYERPRTAFAANFLGEANLIEGGRRAVRPERVRLLRAGKILPEGYQTLLVKVREVVYAGGTITYLCAGQEGDLRVVVANTGEPVLASGEAAQAVFRPEDAVELEG